MEKRIIIVLALAILLLGNVSALTSVRLYNARAVIDAEVGEKIQRQIRMANPNDVDVAVELSVSGDLVDRIKLSEESFTLEPNQEISVSYTISANEPGTTENRIMIKTTPVSGGNGVALSSIIIFNAHGEAIEDDIVPDETDGTEEETDETTEENTDDGKGFSFNPTNKAETPKDFSFSDISPVVYLIGSSALLVLILIILVILAGRKKSVQSTAPVEEKVKVEEQPSESVMASPEEVKEVKVKKKRKAVGGRK